MQKLIFGGLMLFGFILLQFCGQHDSANEHMNHSSFEKLVARFEDPERVTWQKPDSVIAMFGDLTGKTVAEIGAGTGYFSFRLARQAKKVIAIDIDQRFLDYMNERIGDDSSYANVEPRMAAENNPAIQPRETDITLLVNTYHHLEDRINYFGQLRKIAKTGMKLVVVDFKKGDHPVGPPHEIKLSARDVQQELRTAGYAQVRADTTMLPYQYIVTAIAGESAAP